MLQKSEKKSARRRSAKFDLKKPAPLPRTQHEQDVLEEWVEWLDKQHFSWVRQLRTTPPSRPFLELYAQFEKFRRKARVALHGREAVEQHEAESTDHARSKRSETLREREMAQGIAEATKDWDGKHPWEKAAKIWKKIDARLERAGVKKRKGAKNWTSPDSVYDRLKKLSPTSG